MERAAATGEGSVGALLVKSESRKTELAEKIDSLDSAASAHIRRMKRNQASAATAAKLARSGWACNQKAVSAGAGAGAGARSAAAAAAAAAVAADNPQGCECCKPEWLLDQETLDKLAEQDSESNPFAAADFGASIGGVRSRGGRKALDEEEEYDRLSAMRGLGRG